MAESGTNYYFFLLMRTIWMIQNKGNMDVKVIYDEKSTLWVTPVHEAPIAVHIT